MQKFITILVGIAIAVIGGLLVKRFGNRANQTGIGSFTLLPMAGIAYTFGILCVILGGFTIIFGLFV